MVNVKEIFNYSNAKYSPLRNPAREVVKSYQDANRFFDTAQEYVYIEHGMKYLSKIIHRTAHLFPQRFDKFIDMLHERHLMGEYPSTPELNWQEELKDIKDVFSLLVRVLDSIQEALEEFHKVTNNPDLRPMSLKTEEFMVENSREYTLFLELWTRWEVDGGSKTSFDSWCEKILDELEAEDE